MPDTNPVDLSLVASLLRGVAVLTGNESIARVITFAALALETDQDVNEHLKELDDMVKKMVADNRPPDSQEISDLKARSDAAHAAIQAG